MTSLVQRVAAAAKFRADRAAATATASLVTAAARRGATRATLEPGVTVISVSFNTLPYLRAMVAGVRRFSPPGTPVIVVDNGSSDGSVEWAKAQPSVRVVALRRNISHGPAMDIGILRCRTEHFVALDVDAFPVSPSWITSVIEPLSAGAEVAGAGYPPIPQPDRQPYVHACYLAMRTRRFLEGHHTFSAGHSWDTAESISQKEWPNIATIPITSSHGPGVVGSVFGDLVYHNFYSARFAETKRDRIDWVERGQPEYAWATAMDRYFPEGAP